MSTRTPSQSSWLSVGLRMCVSVTVLVDTHRSAPLYLAAAGLLHQLPVDALQHLGPDRPDALLRADFFGGPLGFPRAKRFADAASRSANSRSR